MPAPSEALVRPLPLTQERVESLEAENVRLEGFLQVGRAIKDGETANQVLPYYLLNAGSFVADSLYTWADHNKIRRRQLTEEVIKNTKLIFDRDVEVAERHQKGEVEVFVNVNGERVRRKKPLEHLLYEMQGQVILNAAELAGTPFPAPLRRSAPKYRG